jgi:two-component system KDP operon response regulator KdpE
MRALHRDPQNRGGRIRLGDVVVDLAAVQVIRVPARAGRSSEVTEIRLTPTEWRLLAELLQHPGTLLSREYLLSAVWGPGYAKATGNLRLYVGQLRRKLEPDPSRPRWLRTEPGMGYRYQPDPPARDRTGGLRAFPLVPGRARRVPLPQRYD